MILLLRFSKGDDPVEFCLRLDTDAARYIGEAKTFVPPELRLPSVFSSRIDATSLGVYGRDAISPRGKTPMFWHSYSDRQAAGIESCEQSELASTYV
mmetsp:Transcript_15065/g.26450  ORF Transcript_15065/g.26450 Transcript_15065/m.26450 type:complete len:97 (-) Transcript_15065:2033-2323(-)